MQVNVKLQRNFQTQWNRLEQEYGEQFSKLQGLDEDKLSLTDFMDSFVDSDNVANASVDSNANISQKDIVTMMSEMSKPHQKMLAFHKLYCEIQKMYGFKVANEAFEKMWNYAIYMHDFNTASFIGYCFAYDIKDIVEKGLFFIEGYNAEPAKHLDSFIQILMEAVCFLSRRQSGAVGMPNLIPYLFWYWKKDVDQGYYTKDPETYKRQQIQALIYRLNQPWVRSDQASFTNVSVFDHPYFESIFGAGVFPDGTLMIDYEEEIIQFQKDFIDIVNEIRETNVFTFPVLTASLLYKDGKFEDEEFAKWACEASRKWNLFNFFTSSSITSLSNCCFDKNQEFYYYTEDGTKILTTFGEYVNERLSKEGRDSKAKIVKDVAGEFIEDPNTGEKAEIKALAKLPNVYKEIISLELEDGRVLKVTPDQKVWDNNSKQLVAAEEIYLNPEKFDISCERILNVAREFSEEPVYDIEVATEDHTFMIGDTRVENCRLISEISDEDMNSLGYFNSIGGSVGKELKIGSVKVATLNIARLAFANKTEKKFLAALRELTDLDLKILDAQRHIIQRNVEKGLLPNFTSGLIDFEHLYSTIGINGIYESMKSFGYVQVDELGNTYYKEEAYALGQKIFDTIYECINEFIADKDYKVNIEQVPAEQCAAKFMAADKLLFGNKTCNVEKVVNGEITKVREPIDTLPLRGNQWIPLGIQATIAERTKICAAFDSYCNGGSIEHINVDAPFDTFEKAWKMLNWVAQQGVTYFAFNGKVAQCENYHSYYGDICPVCGKPTINEFTRTVGFYTCTHSWSNERKAEYKLREWMPLNEKGSEA